MYMHTSVRAYLLGFIILYVPTDSNKNHTNTIPLRAIIPYVLAYFSQTSSCQLFHHSNGYIPFSKSPVSTGILVIPGSGPGSTVKFQSVLAKHVEMKSVICASYLCDFGNVIQGLKRKRTFKIFNATATGTIRINSTTLIQYDLSNINEICWSKSFSKIVQRFNLQHFFKRIHCLLLPFQIRWHGRLIKRS